MATKNLKHAIGIFRDRQKAEQAMSELERINFPMHCISAIAKTVENTQMPVDPATHSPVTRRAGAKAGAISGSTGVGLTTLSIGLGALLLPGFGPILALETLLTTFLGSGVAAIAGGVYGAFLGWFAPEKQVQIYRDRFNQGDCLVVIEATESQILSAEPILRRWGVQAWHVYPQ